MCRRRNLEKSLPERRSINCKSFSSGEVESKIENLLFELTLNCCVFVVSVLWVDVSHPRLTPSPANSSPPSASCLPFTGSTKLVCAPTLC